MVQVDPSVAKKRCHNCEIRFFAVQVIFTGVILEGLPRYDEIRVRYDLGWTVGLDSCQPILKWRMLLCYLIHDFLEMYSYFTIIEVWKGGRIVDQCR